jgi:anhydro-N-acetylmuramic acid kinase
MTRLAEVEYCARSLGDAYRRFVLPRFPRLASVGLSGGGARNPTLVQRISAQLQPLEVRVLGEEFLDWKEAIAFALLANETLSGRPGNLPQVTGARRAVILGEIAP